jgi:hypothetical protein
MSYLLSLLIAGIEWYGIEVPANGKFTFNPAKLGKYVQKFECGDIKPSGEKIGLKSCYMLIYVYCLQNDILEHAGCSTSHLILYDKPFYNISFE